jgi:hypothetical protein
MHNLTDYQIAGKESPHGCEEKPATNQSDFFLLRNNASFLKQ